MSKERGKENYGYTCGHVDYRNAFDPNGYKPAERPKQSLRRKIYLMLPDKELTMFWVTTALLVAAMFALIAVSGGRGGSIGGTFFIPIKSGKSTIMMPMRF